MYENYFGSERDSMYQARLEGSYYEMGYQQGKMMKRGVLPPIWSESFHENVDLRRTEFADECEGIVRQHMPDFLDELMKKKYKGNYKLSVLNAHVRNPEKRGVCGRHLHVSGMQIPATTLVCVHCMCKHSQREKPIIHCLA